MYEKRNEINEFEEKPIDENNEEVKKCLLKRPKKEKAILVRIEERKRKKKFCLKKIRN